MDKEPSKMMKKTLSKNFFQRIAKSRTR